MKKTLLISVLLVAALAAAWAGGGQAAGSGSAAGGKMQLTVWGLSTRQGGIDPVITSFNAANPNIEVKGAYYDTDGMKDACKVAASSRTLPDFWFNWGGNLGSFYADNGLTYDLTEYARTNNWQNKFDASVLNLCTFGGKLSGFPISFNALTMYYRKDIFAQYGLKVPTTFAEFEQLCATLKQNGITPISAAGLYGWHIMRILEQFIEHYAGPELHDRLSTFQTSHDTPEVVQALTKFKEFNDKGYFPAGWITADPNATYIDFYAGKAAMDIQGPWFNGWLVQYNQDPSNYDMFPFPNGGKNRLSAFAEMMQFNANLTPEKLAAVVKFMDSYSSIESYQKYPQYIPLPPQKGVPAPADMTPRLLSAASTNGTFTITDQAFPTEIADALFRVQDGLGNGQITPSDGAVRIQAAIDAYLRSN